MSKMAVLSAVLLVPIIMATVASFGLDHSRGRYFGAGDFYNRQYQTWLYKREGGSSHWPSYWVFGLPVGEHYRYFNWKDQLANAMPKRQLNFGPLSFGNYRRYFTNGLQDWKGTFRGINN